MKIESTLQERFIQADLQEFHQPVLVSLCCSILKNKDKLLHYSINQESLAFLGCKTNGLGFWEYNHTIVVYAI